MRKVVKIVLKRVTRVTSEAKMRRVAKIRRVKGDKNNDLFLEVRDCDVGSCQSQRQGSETWPYRVPAYQPECQDLAHSYRDTEREGVSVSVKPPTTAVPGPLHILLSGALIFLFLSKEYIHKNVNSS